MGIGATNRIINPRAIIGQQVKEYRQAKAGKAHRKKNWVATHFGGYAICTQCKRAMRNDIAFAQEKNKRENAPICVACIMGIERKLLTKK